MRIMGIYSENNGHILSELGNRNNRQNKKNNLSGPKLATYTLSGNDRHTRRYLLN